jgi:predicted GH43/DUF377 family glycosyl hydrolase
MTTQQGERIGFQRYAGNPVLRGDQLPWTANAVFNPAATSMPDGTTLMLVRVENRHGHSALHVARSSDGLTGWTVEREPLLAPDRAELQWEWGFEDARITWLDELGVWVITCTAFGSAGPAVFLATTRDFETIERCDVAMPPEDKNAAVFPRRIGGTWLMLHRPMVMARGAADIWISRSDDLDSWRHPERVMTARPGGWWDSARIGIGPPPIETPHGWLLIYHGVRVTVSGAIYRVGAALLDLENPAQVRARLPQWLLGPTDSYERIGDVGNVVFPCGAVVRDGVIRLYYGAADTCIAVAEMRVDDLLGLFDLGGAHAADSDGHAQRRGFRMVSDG